jgi:hypothetical protein
VTVKNTKLIEEVAKLLGKIFKRKGEKNFAVFFSYLHFWLPLENLKI